MRTPDKILEIGAWCLETSHRSLLWLTGGRFPKRLIGMVPVELHTIGRRSGKHYSTMLTSPIFEGDRVVVIASKGGHSDHPDWYKNLTANPRIEITAKGRTRSYDTRTATKDEKSQLWPAITAAYKGYEGYQRNTDRDIPVIICTPVPDTVD